MQGGFKILSRELTGLNLAAKKFAKPLQKEILSRRDAAKILNCSYFGSGLTWLMFSREV